MLFIRFSCYVLMCMTQEGSVDVLDRINSEFVVSFSYIE